MAWLHLQRVQRLQRAEVVGVKVPRVLQQCVRGLNARRSDSRHGACLGRITSRHPPRGRGEAREAREAVFGFLRLALSNC